jgi:DNA-binding Lrp family transcriptional regulator
LVDEILASLDQTNPALDARWAAEVEDRIAVYRRGEIRALELNEVLDWHNPSYPKAQTLYDFGRALEEIPEVLEAYLVSGDYDYYIRIAVRDTRDYERLLRERLYRIPGIRHSKSSFVLRTLKESLLPLSTAPVASSTRHSEKRPRAPVTPPQPARTRAKASGAARRR